MFGAGVLLVVIGTVTYSLGSGWNVVDALYFAVATLTTTSVSDPDLVLQEGWLKLFTVLYLLVGIGILRGDPASPRHCLRGGAEAGAGRRRRGPGRVSGYLNAGTRLGGAGAGRPPARVAG